MPDCELSPCRMKSELGPLSQEGRSWFTGTAVGWVLPHGSILYFLPESLGTNLYLSWSPSSSTMPLFLLFTSPFLLFPWACISLSIFSVKSLNIPLTSSSLYTNFSLMVILKIPLVYQPGTYCHWLNTSQEVLKPQVLSPRHFFTLFKYSECNYLFQVHYIQHAVCTSN